MAFDGNGNWISNFSAVADRDANIKILASRFDNIFIADIASSFENCLTKDTQVKPQQPFNANNYRVINVANPSGDTDAVNKQTLESSLSSSLSTFLNTMYPVGSLYIGTQNTCPMSTLMPGTTWSIVATNRALWGGSGSNGNTTINAGLPNITGNMGGAAYTHDSSSGAYSWTGCFVNKGDVHRIGHDGAYGQFRNTQFDASKSNSIYGASTTVQPPAYRVNVWRRTA